MTTIGDRGETPEEPESSDVDRAHLEPLPAIVRLPLIVLALVFFLLALIGLALPVIPQLVPALLGVTCLSLASQRFSHWIRRRLRRFPWALEKMDRARARIHRLLSRK